jgi:hypothetical protein
MHAALLSFFHAAFLSRTLLYCRVGEVSGVSSLVTQSCSPFIAHGHNNALVFRALCSTALSSIAHKGTSSQHRDSLTGVAAVVEQQCSQSSIGHMSRLLRLSLEPLVISVHGQVMWNLEPVGNLNRGTMRCPIGAGMMIACELGSSLQQEKLDMHKDHSFGIASSQSIVSSLCSDFSQLDEDGILVLFDTVSGPHDMMPCTATGHEAASTYDPECHSRGYHGAAIDISSVTTVLSASRVSPVRVGPSLVCPAELTVDLSAALQGVPDSHWHHPGSGKVM